MHYHGRIERLELKVKELEAQAQRMRCSECDESATHEHVFTDLGRRSLPKCEMWARIEAATPQKGKTMNKTHAQWWLEQFGNGITGMHGLYDGAAIVRYGTGGSTTDVLLYVDGSKLTIPEDGEAVAS